MTTRRFAAAALAALLAGPALGFNSEEHKYLGDFGSSKVPVCKDKSVQTNCVPPSVSFANGAPAVLKIWDGKTDKVARVTSAEQATFKQGAVQRAVGMKAQGQTHYLKEIYVPPAGSDINKRMEAAKPLLVWVGDSSKPAGGEYFTFGDLVAIYGDYRRDVFCKTVEAHEQCLLNDDLGSPNTAMALGHQRRFARGEVAPMGSAGNALQNSEYDDKPYDERLTWWGDEMMRIANSNDWHFSGRAMDWYVGSHLQALHYAARAAAENQPGFLWHAIHWEANGLHSLTDLFAPGHMIVDREGSVDSIWTHAPAKTPLTPPNKKPVYAWYKSVLSTGAAAAKGPLASVADPQAIPTPASSAANTYLGSSAAWARWEESGHTYFNMNGAEVKTLGGKEFVAFGDSRLFPRMNAEGAQDMVHPEKMNTLHEEAEEAVSASLRDVLTAYHQMTMARDAAKAAPDKLKAVEKIRLANARSPEFWSALSHVPVEVKNACYSEKPTHCYGSDGYRAVTYRAKVAALLGGAGGAGPKSLPRIDGSKYVDKYEFDKGNGKPQSVELGLPPKIFTKSPF